MSLPLRLFRGVTFARRRPSSTLEHWESLGLTAQHEILGLIAEGILCPCGSTPVSLGNKGTTP